MKVVIVRDASSISRQLITSQFPDDWEIVIVPAEDLAGEIEDAEAIIPEGAPINSPLLEKARQLKLVQTGAGLDVSETEPLPDDSPLRTLDNVILSPHKAGEPDSLYFHKRRFQFFAANIERVAAGKRPQNSLNDPMDRYLK